MAKARSAGAPMHCRLAVGPLGKRAAVLPRHPHRLDSVLGNVGVVDRQYSLAFVQRGRYQPRGTARIDASSQRAWRRNSCCMCTALASAEEGRVARMIDPQPPGRATILRLEQPLAVPSDALGVATEDLDLLPKLPEDDEAVIARFDVMVLAE